MSPTYTRKEARLYRYYVSQDVLKRGPAACPVGRVPAAEIEAAVVDQLRGIFRQPETIVGTWRAARAEQDDITEDEAREALLALDRLWDELFTAEQARIVQMLVERVDVRIHGVEVRLRPNGLAGLVREVAGTRATVSADGEIITIRVPMTFRRRGGREELVTPDGAPWPRVDNAMVKALARAFRWRKLLDEGVHATIDDLARAKGVAPSYVSGILRLTLLAPDIVEAILDGRQPAELHLRDRLEGFPSEWSRKTERCGTCEP